MSLVQHSLFTVLETTNSKIFPAFCIAVLFKGTKITWYDTWKTWRHGLSLCLVTLLLMLLRFEWFWILEILPDGCLCKALSQDPAGASKSPHQSFKYKKGRRMHVRNWRSKREEAATLKKGSWKKSSLTTVTTSFPQSAEAILSNWNDLNPRRLQYPQSPQTAILRPRSPSQLPKGLKPLTVACGAFLRWARLRETFLRMCLSHLRGSDTVILAPFPLPSRHHLVSKSKSYLGHFARFWGSWDLAPMNYIVLPGRHKNRLCFLLCPGNVRPRSLNVNSWSTNRSPQSSSRLPCHHNTFWEPDFSIWLLFYCFFIYHIYLRCMYGHLAKR